ncbi:MAG: PKD domain-containing protein [Bacteroidales bacterium]|nr:PKD domain-containing protein [Bacteroidales bacterium]
MKNFTKIFVLLSIFIFSNCIVFAQTAKKTDNWVNNGFTLLSESRSYVTISYSLTEFVFEEVITEGMPSVAIRTPGVFLPNEAGAPDLPGTGRYIAMPAGSSAVMRMTVERIEIMKDIDIAPAPKIPLDIEPDALYLIKDERIYSTDAFYPENPVILSEPMQIRGIDVVMLGITPFQYNPVTRELIIYHDLQVEITFEGGNGKVGDDRLRSRWWDPVIKGAVLNANAIPEIDYQVTPSSSRTPDYEYLIITPNLPEFLQWADSIKVWRTLQGIKTGVVTTTDIGGNTTTAIKNYINNAYNTWDVPPVAVLLLGDYSTGSDGVISYLYSHPAGYPNYASDNYFADVNNDNLPDIVFARMTARNESELSVMITKFLNYEKYPPTDASFYNQPITALGWQTSRWFQICSETIGGYFKNVHGMNPVRINALYIGNPGVDPWSTATNTSTVMNYFGPNGLGYIPATPQELGGFTGGTTTDVINAINNGSFLLQHRDHGAYSGWGEPAFYSSNINYLNNVNNKLPFVFSINCQTGAFHNTSECFAEKFHRHTYNGQNSGALGLIAATEVSYSFVNDTYVWGVFDNMFPDFMPGYTTTFPAAFAMPAFGNAAGKYFLQQSSWPYNSSDKLVTYRLFHHHGDAFMPLYYAIPQNLAVTHAGQHTNGDAYFTVTANEGSMIALTVSGEIITVATGTGSALQIPVPFIYQGQTMIVTVTKQNFYRYSAEVSIVGDGIFANFSAVPRVITFGEGVNFTDLSFGEIITWNWSFPGGAPATYSGQNPPVIYYDSPGVYDVTLIVSNGTDSDTDTKIGYITVNDIQYCASNGNATVEWIASVNIGGQVKTSGSSGSAGYEDHTNFVFTLEPGNSYGLTITPGYQGASRFEYYTIWIDFNNDGDFLDAGEEVFNTSKKRNAVSGTINIPSGISVTTRMRVSMSREGLPSPCQIFSYGEVEDFTVEIQAPVPEPPVADFSTNPLQVTVGQSAQFTDLSTNNPTAWAWSFPGGTPASGTSQNPSVTYNTIGTYDVSLTVSNEVGQDTETKIAYIEVVDNPPPPPPSSYCGPVNINNSSSFINQVTIGSVSNTSGKGSSGYLYYTSPVFSFMPGQTYSVSLVPNNNTNRNFWRIWIDFNGDGDFEDSGETLLTINNKKGTATGSINIPSTASGSTRMRISMKTGGSQLPCDDNFNGEVEDYDVNFNGEGDILASAAGQLQLQVYPNPARHELTMMATGNAQPVMIRIFNTQGIQVASFEMSSMIMKLDLNAFIPGLYFIVGNDGKEVTTEKLIIR